MVVHELLVCFLARAWKRIGKKRQTSHMGLSQCGTSLLILCTGVWIFPGLDPCMPLFRPCTTSEELLGTVPRWWGTAAAQPSTPPSHLIHAPADSQHKYRLKDCKNLLCLFFGCQRIVSLWYFCVTWVLPFYISFFPCRCVLWKYPIGI